jgi:hypothetical protein
MKHAIEAVALALLLAAVASGTASAQQQPWWGGATYQGALSSGSTSDFIDQFSWRNVGVEGRKMIREDASVGVFFGWNVFNDEGDATTSIGNIDVSGFQSRFINAFPMLVTAHYYPMSGQSDDPRFFLGTGVGTYYIENRAELGITAIEATNWHFGIAPEVGLFIPNSPFSGGLLSVKYNYAFESDGIEHSYWTFGVGFFVRN